MKRWQINVVSPAREKPRTGERSKTVIASSGDICRSERRTYMAMPVSHVSQLPPDSFMQTESRFLRYRLLFNEFKVRKTCVVVLERPSVLWPECRFYHTSKSSDDNLIHT